MNTVDKVEISVRAGNGGNGSASFRHEKYVPFGGPDGGDGGSGGSVYIKADNGMNNLSIFRRKKVYRAENGADGSSKKKFGKKGDDLEIKVPPGTMVQKVENGENVFLADLREHDQKVIVAKGGRGGLGNVHFATATNQAPQKATKGAPGEEVRLLLDLKVLADIGILGYPNVGKSTLLSAITAAKPRVADYPFTTLEPVLGELLMGNERYVVAEIPGLIEGAHKGRGLGHEFLRHAERTRLLVHVLDGSSRTILDDMNTLNQELGLYTSNLAKKHQIVAINKIDLPDVRQHVDEIREMFVSAGLTVYFISGATGEGIPEFLNAIAITLSKFPQQDHEEMPPVVFRPKPLKKRG